ncbi:MAG: hypothetical protein H0W41_06685 [Chloroflexi bacterium]|nr:hypothetical protein [Chloroflexota bacterium]
MDIETARIRLESMTAWDQEPTLTIDEVYALVEIAARMDPYALTPLDDGWTGTYNFNAAAAEGWRWKAGKVAAEFDFATDQQSFYRTGKYKACMAMAEHYQKRVSGSIRVGRLTTSPS